MGGYDGSIRIRAQLETKGFETGMSRITSSLKKLGALVASVFAVEKIAAFAKSCVDAASSLDNAWTGLQSIVEGQGRSFSTAQKFINDYIKDGLVPLENAVTSYKNLAARGYSDEQIQKVMEALKNSAAFGRQSSYTLGEAVQSATEGLKNENSVLVDNAGVTKNVAQMWKDYAAEIGTSTNDLTKQQKIQAEVNGILEETRFQMGDAAKAAGTYSGQTASLAYNFQSLKVAIGQGIMPLANMVMPVINTIIQGLASLANVFAQTMKLLFGAEVSGGSSAQAEVQGEIASSGKAAADSTDQLAGSTEKAGEAAKKTSKALKGVLADFDELNILASQSADEAAGEGIADALTNVEMPSIDSGGQMFGDVEINPEIEAFVSRLKEALEPTIDACKRLWDELKRLGGFTWEGLKDFYNTCLVPIGQWVLGEGLPRFVDITTNMLANIDWQKINDALHGLWEALAPFAVNVGEGLLWFYENVLAPLGTWVMNEAVPVFLDLLSGVLEVLNAVIEKLKGPAQWLFDHFLKPIAEWTGGVIIDVLKELADLLHDLADVINGDIDFGTFIGQMTPLQTAITGVATALGLLFVGNLIYKAIKALQSLSIWFMDLPFIHGAAQTLSIAFSGIGTGLSSVTWAIETILHSMGPVAGVASTVGGICLGLTNFASMMEGGFNLAKEALMLLGIALTAIGAIILGAPALVAGVIAAIVAVVATLVVVVKDNWDAICEWCSNAWDTICEVWNNACTWFDENVIQPIAEFFSGLWDKICEIWQGVCDWFDENVMTPLKETFGNIRDNISEAFNTAKTNVTNAWHNVSSWFNTNVFQPIKQLVTDVTGVISDLFEGAWIVIQAVWKAVCDWFDENVITPVREAFDEAIEDIKKFFQDCWDKIQEIWGKVCDWFNNNVITPVKNAFSTALENIKQFFSDAWAKVQEVWTQVTTWFDQNVITPVKQKFNDLKDGLVNALNDAWTRIKEIWKQAGEWFREHVAGPIKSAFTNIITTVKKVFNTLLEKVEGMINGVIKGLNGFLSGVSGAIGKAADFIGKDWHGIRTINPVTLPRLANGAVIPPNRQFLALLGDQRSGTNVETPLATIKQAVSEAMSAAGAGLQNTQPIEIKLVLDGRVLTRVVVDGINAMTRSSGRPALVF